MPGRNSSAPKESIFTEPRSSEGATTSAETVPQVQLRKVSIDYTQLRLLHTERYSGQISVAPTDQPVSGREVLRQLTTQNPLVIPVGLGVAVSIIASLLLLAYLALSGRSSNREVCRSHSCHEYARLLADTLDESVNPCYSFTQFVCNGWHQRNQLGLPELVVTDAMETMMRLMDATSLPKAGQDSAQRGLALYRSCHAVLQGKLNELPGVREALREAGITWPLRPTEVDVPHVILATSLKLGWDVMFRVVPLWRQSPEKSSRTVLLNTGRTIIEILNKTSFSANSQHRRSYFDVLREHLLPSPLDSGGNYTDEVSFEEVVYVENISVPRLRKAYYTFEVKVPAQIKNILDIPELGLSRSTWEEALRTFGLNDTMPPSALQLRTVNIEYVNTFLRLWQELGNAKMHLFISWSTAQVGALFANDQLIANFYGGDQKTVNTLHGAFCFSRALAVSGRHLFTQYNQRHRTASALEDARRVSGSVRRSFQKRLLRWSGYQDNVTVITDWSSLDAPFGLLHAINRPVNGNAVREDNAWSGGGSGEFDKMFPDLDENALLSNLRNTTSAVAVASGEYNTQSDVEITAVAASLSTLQFGATFYGLPDFQLLPYVLAFPLYDFEQVPGVNFGGFGAEVAKALSVLTLKAYRRSGPLKSNGIVRNCFRSSPLAGDTNVSPALVEALAMGALVDAYDGSARSDKRCKLRLRDFKDYTGTQMLFIAMCLLKCRGSDAGGTPDSACDLPFSQVPEFAKHFHCSPGTRMNPTDKCELI
ncbi:neprilysin-1-like [Haemaphysalis longicornis]